MNSVKSTPGVIEYFYAAHSAYAYLGAWELARIAKQTGWKVHHRPYDFGPVMEAVGAAPFRGRSTAHIEYFFGRELSRWAQVRNLPILGYRPTHHDNSLALASGLILASGDAINPLSRAILQAHWSDDADLADAATLSHIAEEVGLNGAALLKDAETDAIQAEFSANTDEAIERNIFGSPTYFVSDDMFYGQDRLDMVARAIAQPFAP